VTVHDAVGRCLQVLAAGPSGGGRRVVSRDGRVEHGGRAPAGVYLVRMERGGEVTARKLQVVR
jgi:hypothetical protein